MLSKRDAHHLRKYDKKLPQNVEKYKEKLYISVVMNTKDYDYFVSLSSFNRPNKQVLCWVHCVYLL
ncbi:type III toxin-antitoxin system ToxN/AbiQ family toxin [Lacicoccus qingdaonensis]|uniref:type III toxin-antitoxin system ToxN/AbiQ family toxin n=1 Tax=Lacicoccus qingdaonensis TaxID=576118 RepID=UPI000B83015E